MWSLQYIFMRLAVPVFGLAAVAEGRALFAASRGRRASTNDADRLRKYLARFGLGWADVRA